MSQISKISINGTEYNLSEKLSSYYTSYSEPALPSAGDSVETAISKLHTDVELISRLGYLSEDYTAYEAILYEGPQPDDSIELAISKLHKVILDNEEVVSASLIDLNEKIETVADNSSNAGNAYLSEDYTAYTASSLGTEPQPNDSIELAISKLHKVILDDEYSIATSLINLDKKRFHILYLEYENDSYVLFDENGNEIPLDGSINNLYDYVNERSIIKYDEKGYYYAEYDKFITLDDQTIYWIEFTSGQQGNYIIQTWQQPIESQFINSTAYNISQSDITNWNSKTSNTGTLTGITMNGASKGTSGVVDLGTVITSETDPIFTNHVAYSITQSYIDTWNENKAPLIIDTSIENNTVPRGTYNSITAAIAEGRDVILRVLMDSEWMRYVYASITEDDTYDNNQYRFASNGSYNGYYYIFYIYSNDNTGYYEHDYASASHTHGNINQYGEITSDTAIENGDKIVIIDIDDGNTEDTAFNRISRSTITFDGSTTTTALTPKGTWEPFVKTETDPTVASYIKSIKQTDILNWNSKTDNAGTITGITMNGVSKGTSGVVDLGTVITYHQDISGKADTSAAIGSLSLSMNSSTYVITLSGTKVDGTTFTVSDPIDIPLESVVVDGQYNSTTKKVVLTLKSGSSIEFSIADLINGLQSEITSTNKLSADLISDGATNKTVTQNEKNTWNNKLDSFTETDPIFGASTAATITSADITNWNSKTSNVGTITGITMNGTSKGTSGVVNLGTVLTEHQDISGKVDKVTGMGLSSNDYTTAEKNKLAGINIGDLSSLTTAELNSIFS